MWLVFHIQKNRVVLNKVVVYTPNVQVLGFKTGGSDNHFQSFKTIFDIAKPA